MEIQHSGRPLAAPRRATLPRLLLIDQGRSEGWEVTGRLRRESEGGEELRCLSFDERLVSHDETFALGDDVLEHRGV
jgi:hypothetical protein